MSDGHGERPPNITVEDLNNIPRTVEDDRDDRRVGSTIKFLRSEAGLSQQVLAERMRAAGMDHWRQNTVSRVENGRQELNISEVKVLEEILGGGIMAGTTLHAKTVQVGRAMELTFARRRLHAARRALAEADTALSELLRLWGDDSGVDR